MKRIILSTLFILLCTSFALAADPPSQTIGSYYSMTLSGSGTTEGGQQFLGEGDGDDLSHPCTGKVSGKCSYDPPLYTSRIKGYVHEGVMGITAPTYCVSNATTNQNSTTVVQGNTASESITFDSDLPYSMRIEILVGTWEAGYQFNIQEPANGNIGD